MLTTQKHNNPWSCVYIGTLYATIMMSILLTKQDEIIHIHNIMMKFYNLHVHVKEYRPCWRWSCWLLLHINNTQCNIVSCWWTELTRMYRLYTSSNMTAFSTERELSDIIIHTHTQSELALGKGKKDQGPTLAKPRAKGDPVWHGSFLSSSFHLLQNSTTPVFSLSPDANIITTEVHSHRLQKQLDSNQCPLNLQWQQTDKFTARIQSR